MPETDLRNINTSFVLFGAGGDLAQRLVVPALFNLFIDHQLPEQFLLLGLDRKDMDDAALAAHYQESVAKFSRRGVPAPADWQNFSAHIRYQKVDVTVADDMLKLAEHLKELESSWQRPADRVFYLAVSTTLFAPIANALGKAGLAEPRERTRIVVEKPIGNDLESFRRINSTLCANFEERQLYRIDHFLGKETVQNILAMRFANPIFEPIWNRRYIDHVSITVAETLGVERRAGYYEQAGALRDMVQNHLFQLLCIVAMEPPLSYDADDVRNKKLDVLRALRPIPPDAVSDFATRGQYGAGWIEGVKMQAYRDEPGVDPQSNTETYAALKLYIDNWRWQEVPFYMRTGKRMAAAVWEISVRFRDVPHRAFPASSGLNAQPARLVIQMQPEQGIVLKFMAKEPGAQLHMRLVDMRFSYSQTFKVQSPDAYETLLWDVLRGDQTLFMRADQVEAAWRVLMPVLNAWADNVAPDFPNYAAGSWGPEAAEVLVASTGNSWLIPTLPVDAS